MKNPTPAWRVDHRVYPLQNHARSRRHPFVLASVLIGLSLGAGVLEAKPKEYDVRHDLRLKPGGNVVPKVKALYYAHSYTKEWGPKCTDWAVVPVAQGPKYDPLRRDILRNRRGRVRSKGTDHRYHDVNVAEEEISSGGEFIFEWATSDGCNSWADANVWIDVDSFAAGDEINGTIWVFGTAEAALRPPRSSHAYAFSMALVEAQGGRELRNGNIRWRKTVRDIVVGRASQSRRQVDPIEYTVTDLETGEVHEGTLYSVEVDIHRGSVGGFSWDNDLVEITARNVDFKVDFPSPLTSVRGHINLKIRNGVVVESDAAGHYAGVLPPVGAEGPFSFPVSDEVEFDYDLGDFDGHDVEVELDFSGAGEAVDEASIDPALTVVGDPSGESPAVTLSWTPQNVPVDLQCSPDMKTWITLPDQPRDVAGLHEVLLPIWDLPGRFFRVQPDETQPPVDEMSPRFTAEGICGPEENLVLVRFTEPVDPVLAQDPFLYQLTDFGGRPLPIMDTQMLDPQHYMLLPGLPLLPDQPYQLMLQGVLTDMHGNQVPHNFVAPVKCDPGGGPHTE